MLYDQNCTVQAARDRLAAFRFRGEDVFKPVSALSGGEQSRLRLCMLMDAKINLLILDEPTNHLDLSSREWIEEAVEAYGGAVIFVSHDRYFISRFAERVWMLENGSITDFEGGFEAFQSARARQEAAPQPQKQEERPQKAERPKRPGGTKQLEKDVLAAERAVAKAEEQLYELTLEMEEAACNYLTLQELCQRKEALEEEIAGLYARWEALAGELEAASGEAL
ncbi:Vitamin B12 import ATP-binding protein BtuD [bioreactor metagenome]|uniref:Vitamin B12 import ATP-binding protein BtuD n=1 Tax=bioreactor metagenome TaxID=1076179 RepID=A0A645DZP8_9ZZZZ